MAKLGPLNHFCTPGSFPDSHFSQLKSHWSSQLCSNMGKYFKRHSVVRTLTSFSEFSHCNKFLRVWHRDTSAHAHTHINKLTLTKSSPCDWAAQSSWKVDRQPHPDHLIKTVQYQTSHPPACAVFPSVQIHAWDDSRLKIRIFFSISHRLRVVQ